MSSSTRFTARRVRFTAAVSAVFVAVAVAASAAPKFDDPVDSDPYDISCPPSAVIDGNLHQNGLALIDTAVQIEGSFVKVSIVSGAGCGKTIRTGLPFEWSLAAPVTATAALHATDTLAPHLETNRAGAHVVTLTYCPATCPNQPVPAEDPIDIPPLSRTITIAVKDTMVMPPETQPELPYSTRQQGPAIGGRDLDAQGRTIFPDAERNEDCAGGGGTVDPQWVTPDEWNGSQDYTFLEGTIRSANIAGVDAEVNHYSHDAISMVAPHPSTRGVMSWKPEGDGVVGIEWESNEVPGPMRGLPGDMVSAYGFLILDCNHSPYYTEIHPPVMTAVQRPRPIALPESLGLGSNIHVPGVVTDIWANKEAGEITGNCSDTGLAQPAKLVASGIAYAIGDCIRSPHPVDRVFEFRIYLPPGPHELMRRAGRTAAAPPLHISIGGHPALGSVGAPVPVVVPVEEEDPNTGELTTYLRVILDLRGLTGKTYARRITAAWAYPAPASVPDNWGLSEYLVRVDSLRIHDDEDWPDDGDWFLWFATNNRDREWTRLLHGNSGNVESDTTHDFGDRPWRTGSSDPQRDLGPHLLAFPPEQPLRYSFDLSRRVFVHSSGYDAEFFDDPIGRVNDLHVPPSGQLVGKTLSQKENSYTLNYQVIPLGSVGPEVLTDAGHALSERFTIRPSEDQRCQFIRDVCLLMPSLDGTFVDWHPVDQPATTDPSLLNWFDAEVFEAQPVEEKGLDGISLPDLQDLLETRAETDPGRITRFAEEVREEFDGSEGAPDLNSALPVFEGVMKAGLWNRHFGDIDPTPPDLAVVAMAMSPPGAAEGSPVELSATVENVGTGGSPASRVDVSVDGVSLGTLPVPELAAGERRTVTFPAWTAVRGPHEVRATADALGQVIEVDEANDVVRQIAITNVNRGLPDLKAQSATVETTADGTRFVARVKSEGGNVLEAFVVRFLVDGEEIGRRTVHGLAADAVADVASPAWQPVTGDHRLRVIVDEGNAVAESDEGDNVHIRSFPIG